MKTSIQPIQPGATAVSVTFDHAGVTHTRNVNAVFTAGAYDREATADRVAQVARGVAHKIALGVVTNPDPAPEPAA